MKYLHLLWAGLRRRPLRTAFTMLSTFFAFLLFGLLAATRMAFDGGVDVADAQRLFVINKVSLIQPLPMSYGNRIAAIDGVEAVVGNSWFGGYFQEKKNFFANFAVDENYLDLYPELVIGDGERQRWNATRDGVLLGEALAQRFGWKVGDRIPLISPIYTRKDGSNTWDFEVTGIMRAGKQGVDTTYLIFHTEYLDEGRSFGEGTIGWYLLKIDDAGRAAQVGGQIDAMFANSPTETRTAPEDAFVADFARQVGDIGKIFSSIVTVVLFTLFLVTANTMAQGVRERTSELAVMNVLGFSRRKLALMLMAESVLLVLVGGGLAMLIAKPMTAAIGQSLSGFLPTFYLTTRYVLVAFALMVLLGVFSGLVPAIRALTMKNVDGLRRVA